MLNLHMNQNYVNWCNKLIMKPVRLNKVTMVSVNGQSYRIYIFGMSKKRYTE